MVQQGIGMGVDLLGGWVNTVDHLPGRLSGGGTSVCAGWTVVGSNPLRGGQLTAGEGCGVCGCMCWMGCRCHCECARPFLLCTSKWALRCVALESSLLAAMRSPWGACCCRNGRLRTQILCVRCCVNSCLALCWLRGVSPSCNREECRSGNRLAL
jgi:hypothetical protein